MHKRLVYVQLHRAVCLGCSHTERKGFKKAPPSLNYHYHNK